MKKKLLSVLLSVAMVATLLTGCGSKGGDGSVYYLNFKPEQDEAWQN